MHIAYVCSPNRESQLFISMRSLLVSGSSFDRVTVYCVGPLPSSWQFGDDRIHVEEVPDIGEGFWMLNKTHLCRSEARDLVFLDTDTIVMEPLDLLLAEMNGDVAGRLSTFCSGRFWREDLWEDALKRYGAKKPFPYFSTGLLVFRNRSHRNIRTSWPDITRKLRKEKVSLLNLRKRANQLAFSLACAAEGLSPHLLNRRHHAYGWLREKPRSTVVFHAGDIFFFNDFVKMPQRTEIMSPMLPVPLPASLKKDFIRERVRYPLKLGEWYFKWLKFRLRWTLSG